jgi:hypothetical protein
MFLSVNMLRTATERSLDLTCAVEPRSCRQNGSDVPSEHRDRSFNRHESQVSVLTAARVDSPLRYYCAHYYYYYYYY